MLVTKKDIKVIIENIGEILQYFSATFLLCLPIVFIYQEPLQNALIFITSAAITYFFGKCMHLLCKTDEKTTEKTAILTVVFSWLIIPLFGSMPYILLTNVSLLDAYFESVSALTTTGISVLSTELSKSLIFWRSLECWIGGVGIIVLALIGINKYSKSFRLLAAEGREERLRYNVINTVKAIWKVYVAITLIGFVLLLLNGISPFNALNLSMSGVSTTGFTPMNRLLLGDYTLGTSLIMMLIMILGATSFLTHHRFLKGDLLAYLKDQQFLFMICVILISTPVMTLYFHNPLITSFHITGAITTGGFTGIPQEETLQWHPAFLFLIIVFGIIGGSAGSTGGGIKIIRFLTLIKALWWEAKKQLFPKEAVFSKTLDNEPVSRDAIILSLTVIGGYIITVGFSTLVITAYGYPIKLALLEAVSAQGNMGFSTGIAQTGPPVIKICLILNMIIGRLEVIPIITLACSLIGRLR